MSGAEIKVGILSTSAVNRNNWRQLLNAQGASVVCTADIRNFNLPEINPPNVLLVDVDSADDATFAALDTLSSTVRVPVLISEGLSVSDKNSSEAQTLSTSLIKKLRSAVESRRVAAQAAAKPAARNGNSPAPRQRLNAVPAPTPAVVVSKPVAARNTVQEAKKNSRAAASERPAPVPGLQQLKNSNITLGIVSKSKTRAMAMAKLMGDFPRVISYIIGPNLDTDRILGGSDIMLIDRHNLSGDELAGFKRLTGQTSVPFVLCNSSELAAGGTPHKTWGETFLRQLQSAYQQHALNRRKQQQAADKAAASKSPAKARPASDTAAAKHATESPGDLSDMLSDMQWDAETRRVQNIIHKLPQQTPPPAVPAAKPAKKATAAAPAPIPAFDPDKAELEIDKLMMEHAALADMDDTFNLDDPELRDVFRDDDMGDITQYITGPDGEFGLHNPFHFEEDHKQPKSWFGGILSALQRKGGKSR